MCEDRKILKQLVTSIKEIVKTNNNYIESIVDTTVKGKNNKKSL